MLCPPGTRRSATLAVTAVLALWFALVWLLGWEGAFVRPPGVPPLPILVGASAPLVAFLAALRLVPIFREFAMALDLRLVTGVQAWRFAGFTFLALYTQRLLPGLFAWPAGLGDIAIGVTAPWVVVSLIRRPGFAASRPFVLWNLLGILDLVVAVGTGSAIAAGVLGGVVTTGLMAELPLVIIPAYLVPLFVMLHLTALLQARSQRARPA